MKKKYLKRGDDGARRSPAVAARQRQKVVRQNGPGDHAVPFQHADHGRLERVPARTATTDDEYFISPGITQQYMVLIVIRNNYGG